MEEQLAQPSSVESIQRQLDDLTEIVEVFDFYIFFMKIFISQKITTKKN